MENMVDKKHVVFYVKYSMNVIVLIVSSNTGVCMDKLSFINTKSSTSDAFSIQIPNLFQMVFFNLLF